MRHINRTIACTVSALIYQLFFTPDVSTWLHVELGQTDHSVSVMLTTKVRTVYCIGTVRKKQILFFLNVETNKSTAAEKYKNSKCQFFFLPFLEIFGGDSLKQLNKFVWQNSLGNQGYFATVADLILRIKTICQSNPNKNCLPYKQLIE